MTTAPEYPFHPLAEIFPLIEGEEFEALVDSIKANGLREPIVVLDNMILDGRNRARACEAAGVQPVRRPFLGDDPAAFVIDANLHRRHLTTEQKRDLIAKVLKAKPASSDRQIAKITKVDHKTVGTVRDDLEATGEIPQLEKTVGGDGKARKRQRSAKKTVEQSVAKSAPKVQASKVDIIDVMATAVRIARKYEKPSKKHEIMRADVEHLAEKLAKNVPDIARLLYDILWTDDRHVHAFVAALGRGLGIDKDEQAVVDAVSDAVSNVAGAEGGGQ